MAQEERTATIGPIQMSEKELNGHLENGNRYIVSGQRAYHIEHVNYKPEYIPFYGRQVYFWPKPKTKRGEYIAINAEQLNRMIGHDIFTD